MANKSPNFKGLLIHAKSKTDSTITKVEDTLKLLIKTQKKINFNSVSEEAGISKGFLYKNTELRQRIELLRKQQLGLTSPKQVKRNMSDASKDVIIAALRNRLIGLENENKQLKERLKKNLGKVYDEI